MKYSPIVVCAFAASAHACGESLTEPRTIESARYVVAYSTKPQPILANEHFVVDFEICPRATATISDVRVDANMPEHRHGMNYRPAVTRVSARTYRAEGLLFHMQGRWEMTFDIASGSNVERLTTNIVLE